MWVRYIAYDKIIKQKEINFSQYHWRAHLTLPVITPSPSPSPHYPHPSTQPSLKLPAMQKIFWFFSRRINDQDWRWAILQQRKTTKRPYDNVINLYCDLNTSTDMCARLATILDLLIDISVLKKNITQ